MRAWKYPYILCREGGGGGCYAHQKGGNRAHEKLPSSCIIYIYTPMGISNECVCVVYRLRVRVHYIVWFFSPGDAMECYRKGWKGYFFLSLYDEIVARDDMQIPCVVIYQRFYNSD